MVVAFTKWDSYLKSEKLFKPVKLSKAWNIHMKIKKLQTQRDLYWMQRGKGTFMSSRCPKWFTSIFASGSFSSMRGSEWCGLDLILNTRKWNWKHNRRWQPIKNRLQQKNTRSQLRGPRVPKGQRRKNAQKILAESDQE